MMAAAQVSKRNNFLLVVILLAEDRAERNLRGHWLSMFMLLGMTDVGRDRVVLDLQSDCQS